MRLHPTETQQQLLDAVDRLSASLGGMDHLRSVFNSTGFDRACFDLLREGGFLGLALDPELSALEATMVVELTARHGHAAGIGAAAIVVPALLGRAAEGPVALAPAQAGATFRFGAVAREILIDGGDEALLLTVQSGDVVEVENDRAGPALAALTEAGLGRARPLGSGSGEILRAWWRVALAAETTGAMRGAMTLTARYMIDRVQFGRPLASFQALQHRLAHLAVQVEGAYWTTLEAASRPGDAQAAAIAATQAIVAAPQAFRECHQMHGAMGFTREYPLHVWTMQLPALQTELGGLSAHARLVSKARYAACS